MSGFTFSVNSLFLPTLPLFPHIFLLAWIEGFISFLVKGLSLRLAQGREPQHSPRLVEEPKLLKPTQQAAAGLQLPGSSVEELSSLLLHLLEKHPLRTGGVGWGWDSVVECLPGLQEALGSIPNTGEKKRENARCGFGRREYQSLELFKLPLKMCKS